MNKNNAKDYLPLVIALSDGKTIQHNAGGIGCWSDIANPTLDVDADLYRIKPEPIERWLAVFSNGDFGTFPHCTKRHAMQQFNAVSTIKLREVTE